MSESDDQAASVLEAAMDWLLRLEARPGDPALARELRAWLTRSPAHRDAWQQAQRTWQVLGEVPPIYEPLWRRDDPPSRVATLGRLVRPVPAAPPPARARPARPSRSLRGEGGQALLKAVQVDPGVAPADAGPGALAGSIAYETKDAAELLEPGRLVGGSLKSSYETNGDTFTNGVTGYGALNGFEFLGYLSYATGDDFEAGNGRTVVGTGADFLSGLGKVA